MIGIYKITNKLNGLIYIGQSREVEKRLYSHFCSREDSEIDIAIKEEGLNNFLFEVIELCDVEQLNEREIY